MDQHTLAVVRNLRVHHARHAQEYPLASQLIAGLDRHWLLYVAALFHDIAKGRGSDRLRTRRARPRRFAHEHGLDAGDTELAEFLVRQHLLALSAVAQKRDLSDPAVIQDFAAIVRTNAT